MSEKSSLWEVRRALERIEEAYAVLAKAGFVSDVPLGDKSIYVNGLRTVAKNLGAELVFKRRLGYAYSPFIAELPVGDFTLYEAYTPEEIGCTKIGTKKVAEEFEEVIESRTSKRMVDRGVYKCPEGKTFVIGE